MQEGRQLTFLAPPNEAETGLSSRRSRDLDEKSGTVDFDQLDKEREEMDFEGLDDFLRGVEDTVKDSAADLGRIKSLEKSLEDEKRRLASMELQLRDAKKQQDSEQQLVVVQKQSKVLATMFQQLTNATRSEVSQRQEWEAEWRTKFDDFHRQHKEMEDALKRKHVAELKELQEDIQKSIRRIALDVQRTRGKSAPSPRTMGKVSEHNMERLVSLYHKHGQERLFLSSKISNQEEVLVRAKNQSLQRFIVDSQSKCNRLYRKFNLPTSKSTLEMRQDAVGNGTLPTKRKPRAVDIPGPQPRTGVEASRSRGGTAWAGGTGPLPSPRINDGNMTFLTEIGGEDDTHRPVRQPAKQTGHGGPDHAGFQPATAPSGSLAAAGSTMPAAGPLSATMPAASTPNLQPTQTLSVTYSAGASFGGMTAVQAPSSHTLPAGALSAEFAGWGKAAPPPEEGRPKWDGQALVPPPQWHPNIIAFEPSGATTASKAGASPYLGMTGGLGGLPRGGKGSGRGGKAKSTAGRSRGAKPSQGPAPTGRSLSTAPRIEQTLASPFGRSLPPGAGGGEAARGSTLPHIVDRRGGRVQATDHNLSRPLTELATHDDLPSKEQKLHKLETWIEDRIRSVLGDEGSRSHILSSTSKLPPAPLRSESAVPARIDDRGRTPSPAAAAPGEWDPRHTASSSLMSTLQASMAAGEPEHPEAEAEEDGEAGEGNAGFVVQDADERMRRQRREEQKRKGREVEQAFESSPVRAGGKTARDGTHVDLAESAELAGRRKALEGVAARKGGKRVGWDLGDDTEGGTDGEEVARAASRPQTDSSAVSGLLARPETSASSHLGETEPEDGGDGEGKPDRSRRPRRGRGEGGEEEGGPDVSQESVKDLFSKVRHNKVPEVEELLARGFPIEQRDGHGNTPLMVAAQNGHKRLVKMTLRYGADPNASNHQGNTALHFATSYGYTALSKYLTGKGADDTLINLKGLTCYDGIG